LNPAITPTTTSCNYHQIKKLQNLFLKILINQLCARARVLSIYGFGNYYLKKYIKTFCGTK
jgi:hypothetical protein